MPSTPPMTPPAPAAAHRLPALSQVGYVASLVFAVVGVAHAAGWVPADVSLGYRPVLLLAAGSWIVAWLADWAAARQRATRPDAVPAIVAPASDGAGSARLVASPVASPAAPAPSVAVHRPSAAELDVLQRLARRAQVTVPDPVWPLLVPRPVADVLAGQPEIVITFDALGRVPSLLAAALRAQVGMDDQDAKTPEPRPGHYHVRTDGPRWDIRLLDHLA